MAVDRDYWMQLAAERQAEIDRLRAFAEWCISDAYDSRELSERANRVIQQSRDSA
jgi:hypothetical protein